jgi:hypothetical protein
MNKLCLLLSALVPLVANAQLAPNYHRLQAPANAPKVVFVGDYVTAQWASAFAANPNWINQGNPEGICYFTGVDPSVETASKRDSCGWLLRTLQQQG